jgi:hypothetical protein
MYNTCFTFLNHTCYIYVHFDNIQATARRFGTTQFYIFIPLTWQLAPFQSKSLETVVHKNGTVPGWLTCQFYYQIHTLIA